MASHHTLRRWARISVVPGALAIVFALTGTALAVVPLTTVSTDPYTNTSSYHQTELEPDTYSFGSTIVGVFQTGRFTDGGANNIGWATSTDNGASWTNGFLPSTTVYANPPGPWDRISDPSVAYDPKHDVWIASGLAITGTTGKAVLASRSFDGGLTWQAPVTVAQGGNGNFLDKEWITCDTTAGSSFYGNCYVQWDDFFQGNALKMSRSTDGGATWTPSTVPSVSVIGGQPVVRPNGTVVMPITANGLQSFISTNGGVSYTGPFTIASIIAHGATNMRDGTGLASAEIDAGGTVYVAWSDCRFRTSCQADDIVFSTSSDGMTWSAVKRVPLVGTSSQVEIFLLGMGVDHATQGTSAHLGVTFYAMPTNSCNSGTCKILGGFVSSTNAGQNWSRVTKVLGPIKQTWLPSAGGYFLGDYMSTSFGSNGKAYPVFANATGPNNCVLGQITSCHEFMVSPTNGLSAVGGTIPAGHKAIATGSAPRPAGRLGTAF